MLNRMKIITGLIITLLLFGILQLASGAFFFFDLKDQKEEIALLAQMRNQRILLNEGWVHLLKARIQLNRAGVSYLLTKKKVPIDEPVGQIIEAARLNLVKAREYFDKYQRTAKLSLHDPKILADLSKNYTRYMESLHSLIFLLENDQIKDFSDQPTSIYQQEFSQALDHYLNESLVVYDEIIGHSEVSYRYSVYTLFVVLSALILLLILCWFGIHRLLINPLNSLLMNIKAFSAGDLSSHIAINGNNEMGRLAAGLKHMQYELIQIVKSVSGSADKIYARTSEIATGNSDLSTRSEQQVAALEETAASMEELTITVKQNAEHATQANKLADSASEIAWEGGQVVANVVDTMKSISESAQKIADITSVIDGIAFQTNILALNAAVEAARAGEHGRGFAVVAEEVRNLAQRSANAAKEIKGLIENSVSRTLSGAKLAEEAGETMGKIVESVVGVTEIMGEIASASDEQSKGINQVSIAINEMDHVLQHNASLVEQSGAATAELEIQTKILTDLVSVFKLPQEDADEPYHQSIENLAKGVTEAEAIDDKKKVTHDDNWTAF
ncbi:methyl-accepting chemotaxis protein [Arsenophonus nasoniae]|uniref:methyl-accepting chemotaxis protein n=1 Tax=Arsenophonus nasoniae TaxID=638 RepID=UPI00387A58A0